MDWCILQCASNYTIRLAASLAEVGFETWTPVETVTRRVREGAKPEPIRRAMTPRFVFARSQHQVELLALSHSPSLNYRVWDPELRRMVTRGHPYFRVFMPLGRVETVPERQLTHLRAMERKTQPKPIVEPLEAGERVRLGGAGFDGLWATVQSSTKANTAVLIDGWSVVMTVPTWALKPALDEGHAVNVNGMQSDQAA